MAVRVMKEADMPSVPHIRRNSPEGSQRPRQAGPMLHQPAFVWQVPDRYVELYKFSNGESTFPPSKSI